MTRPIANNTVHSRLGSQSDTEVKEGDQKKVSDQEINSLENSEDENEEVEMSDNVNAQGRGGGSRLTL